MDDFEIYIQSNKEAFEEQPLNKTRLWQKIEQDLDAETKYTVFALHPLLKIAAMLALFLGFGLFAYFIGTKQTANQNTNEITEIKSHYKQLINLKLMQIENTDPLTESEKKTYLQIMEDLDKEANELNYDLQQNINNEVVIEAIVQNYKQRLQLLELLLNRSQKNKIKNNEQLILI